MIEAEGLSKFYGGFAAIRRVSFSVPRGQVAAFLGPNGAGKSTTLKVLTGYLAPSVGTARIGGMDVQQDRLAATAHLGYLPENGPLYPDMTPLELLRFFGRARGLTGQRLKERLEAVVARCALEAVLEKNIRKLSKGFRQRVGMAQVLLHEPDVLIMDEPTAGLDPNQIREVRHTIRELAQSKTVLLSTHILQEVEAVADRVIFIDRGRVVFDGTLDQMRGAHASLEEAFYALTGQAPAVQAAAGPPQAAVDKAPAPEAAPESAPADREGGPCEGAKSARSSCASWRVTSPRPPATSS